MEGHAATAIVLPLDLANHLALIKTSDVTNRRRHRGRKIVARCAGGDPSLARRRARPHSLRTILGGTGDCRGEAVWGSASGVLAITRGPESKMSAAGAQSDSTRHPKYNFRLPASFGNWRRPPRGTRCCGLDAAELSRSALAAHVRFCERAGVRFPCATHVVILYRRGSAEKALRHLFEGVLPRNMTNF